MFHYCWNKAVAFEKFSVDFILFLFWHYELFWYPSLNDSYWNRNVQRRLHIIINSPIWIVLLLSLYIYIYIYIYTLTSMHMYTYAYVPNYVDECMNTYTHTHIYVYIYIYIYIIYIIYIIYVCVCVHFARTVTSD